MNSRLDFSVRPEATSCPSLSNICQQEHDVTPPRTFSVLHKHYKRKKEFKCRHRVKGEFGGFGGGGGEPRGQLGSNLFTTAAKGRRGGGRGGGKQCEEAVLKGLVRDHVLSRLAAVSDISENTLFLGGSLIGALCACARSPIRV